MDYKTLVYVGSLYFVFALMEIVKQWRESIPHKRITNSRKLHIFFYIWLILVRFMERTGLPLSFYMRNLCSRCAFRDYEFPKFINSHLSNVLSSDVTVFS